MSDAPMPPMPPQSTPMPPMPPQSTPSAGALGKPREIGTCILLAIVTIGIYTYVWTYKTHDEMKRHSGEGLGGGLGFLIYFLLSPVTFFLVPSEIKNIYLRAGRTSPVTPIVGLWFLLPLIGGIIWFSKVQGALNDYWKSLGAQ